MNEKNEHSEFEILTGKYLAGEITGEEVQKLEQWVKASEANKKMFLDYKRSWQLTHAGKIDTDVQKAWKNIEKELFAEDKPALAVDPPSLPRKMKPIWRYAAIISVLVSIGFLLYFILYDQEKELVASDAVISETLNDGSIVTLNQNTTLIYPRKFGKDERRVKLVGDAFFEVARNEQKPFIIETPQVTVKVLGTSFYVDAREEIHEIEVFVTSGKVMMISPAGRQIELTKGEKGIFNKENNALKEEASEDENFLAWKTGSIRFDNTSLANVAKVLNRTYNVHITLQNRFLENCLLTATFEDLPLDDVLQIIGETLDLKVNKTANSIILSGTGCE